MLALDVHDDEVAVSQHLGVVNVDRLAVGSAPGDDGPGIAGGHALQDGGLVQRHRAVLRRCDDAGPQWTQGAGRCRRGRTERKFERTTRGISSLCERVFFKKKKNHTEVSKVEGSAYKMFKETRLTAMFCISSTGPFKASEQTWGDGEGGLVAAAAARNVGGDTTVISCI